MGRVPPNGVAGDRSDDAGETAAADVSHTYPRFPLGTALNWGVCASTAVYGFTLAVALAPKLQFRARPGEPLSALHEAGFSPRGPVLQFLLAVLLTALFAVLATHVVSLLAEHRWAAGTYCAALLLAPASLMCYGNLRHVLLLGLVAIAIVVLRKRDPHFTRRDVVLIPIYFSCYIAFLDLGFGKTPVSTFLRAAIVLLAFRLAVRSADAFLLSPLALLFQTGLLPSTAACVVALVVLFATPFLLVRTKWTPAPAIVYAIVVFSYPLAVLNTNPPFAMNFFEDGHGLPVASEILRGERPYRDIIPTHGVITDGVLDALSLKLGGRSLRTVLRTRLVVGVLSGVAIYSLALAATGSAELGLLAAFLAFSLFSGSALWLRPSAAIFALAATVAATRLRSQRWFVAAGALVVLGYFVSIDFGLYSAIVALFAAFRARALRALAVGVAAAAIPSLLLFAIFGFALDFIRVNVLEIFGGHGVYFVKLLEIPQFLCSPAFLHHLSDPDSVTLIAWMVALAGSSVALASSPFRARPGDAPWLIGVWMVVATTSFVERGNIYFTPVIPAFLIAMLWLLWQRARTVAAILAVALILYSEPFRHIMTVVPQLRVAKPMPLFDPPTVASIGAAGRFIGTLHPEDTFVDFSNSAILYALFNRDCPLRQVEVANYQAEDAQREVIRRIESNPHIRAALVSFRGSNQRVDGIPNAVRAPLVWAYLQKNFAPAFEQEGVVFWRRVR